MGIGLLAGIVGVLALVALDLIIRRRFGVTDFLATLVLLVAGLLGVVFAWTFGVLHARLSVLIGSIERAEDELRREKRNRKGVLPGDPSMNEASSPRTRAEAARRRDRPDRRASRPAGPVTQPVALHTVAR
ncbi:MAG: hypothetical protein ACFHWZ_18400 [Phycisphaerales bacterium]